MKPDYMPKRLKGQEAESSPQGCGIKPEPPFWRDCLELVLNLFFIGGAVALAVCAAMLGAAVVVAGFAGAVFGYLTLLKAASQGNPFAAMAAGCAALFLIVLWKWRSA